MITEGTFITTQYRHISLYDKDLLKEVELSRFSEIDLQISVTEPIAYSDTLGTWESVAVTRLSL